MKRTISMMIAVVLAVGVWSTTAMAKDGTPKCEGRGQRLLDKFGDQGIDADGDGTLTREEVKTFFEANPDLLPAFGEGRRGAGFKGNRGKGFGAKRGGPAMGRGHYGRRGPARGLRMLDTILSETPPEDMPPRLLAKVDTDGDESVSAEEWRAFTEQAREKISTRVMKRFPEADADKDGTLSDEELQTFKAQHVVRLKTRLLERHPEVDVDNDGAISDEELEAFRADRKAGRVTKLLDKHPELDTDNDGILSDEELSAARKQRNANHRQRILDRFPEADADGNGELSDEEAKAFRGKMKEQRSQRRGKGQSANRGGGFFRT